ncbi:hypothetical protein I9W82_000296 [Candida metapsilosis]|uniref:protein-histidine N-methyltransferase n=1 Tax=Candida metapsilosis TaxID=273372 RepID=A0A8H8DEE4_9ASCO|nr:hypothetical protein I9W82_000296 [Candida metapsilosis]
MSFAFGFTNEDLSDDDLTENQVEVTSKKRTERALDTFEVLPEHQPKVHSLTNILQTLENVRLTFDNYTTPGGQIVYRRELYDVKHQIMMEEDKDVSNKLSELLIERNDADVQSNVYEGGFKSWECSYDSVDELHEIRKSFDLFNSSVLELGCGTALPSCYILQRKFEHGDKRQMSIVLSDFNYDVLRLVTIPNLLINWASTLPIEELHRLTTDEVNSRFENNEVFVTHGLIEEFERQLKEFNVELIPISGSWGREFNSLVETYKVNFIISSETIYSPNTLPVVAESIKDILEKAGTKGRALVAAKNIYFGVGGSVIEYLTYFNSIKGPHFKTDSKEIIDSSLRRSLISIEYDAPIKPGA